MKDLDIIYQYYKSLYDQNLPLKGFNVDKDADGNRIILPEKLFGYIVDYYGFNGFPEIVSDEEFNAINCKKLYRGYKDFDHGANSLLHYKYHYGTGCLMGIGMYFSDCDAIAAQYTKSSAHEEKDWKRVLKVKLDSNNFLSFGELNKLKLMNSGDLPRGTKHKYIEKIKELEEFKKEHEGDGELIDSFMRNMRINSIFAVYLGVDYIYHPTIGYRVVYNRGIIKTTQAEKDKFVKNSEHYRDGAYDFHDCVYPNDNVEKA